MSAPITGTCEAQFEHLKEVFSRSLEDGHDLGAGVTVIRKGEVLVDLRGGHKDRQKTEEFGETLVCVYSCGKAIVSALVMAALDQGQMSLEDPISSFWPEFGAHGKEEITLGDALSHQSSLAAFLEPIDPTFWLDWEGLCQALADLPPIWPPRVRSGYHPQTYGYIVGETYRRATGMTIGKALKDLHADVHCGLPASLQQRVGPMVKPPAAPDLGPLTDLKKAAFLAKWSSPSGVSREAWMAAEIPASNMHATSHGLASIMQAFATGQLGHSVISTGTRNQMLAERCQGDDLVLPFNLSWAAGVMRNVGGHYGPSSTAVGHYGFGGACVMADPAHELSFAYVPNKMSPHLVRDPRAISLMEALYEAL